MPIGDDFRDLTPQPVPTPKKRYIWPDDTSAINGVMTWTAGQTFSQMLNANLPATLRGRTFASTFVVKIQIVVEEQ